MLELGCQGRELHAGRERKMEHLAGHAVVVEAAGCVLVKPIFQKPEEAESPHLSCLLISYIGPSCSTNGVTPTAGSLPQHNGTYR